MLNDTTNIEDRQQNSEQGDPKDWQPLHNYIQLNKILTTSKKPDY